MFCFIPHNRISLKSNKNVHSIHNKIVYFKPADTCVCRGFFSFHSSTSVLITSHFRTGKKRQPVQISHKAIQMVSKESLAQLVGWGNKRRSGMPKPLVALITLKLYYFNYIIGIDTHKKIPALVQHTLSQASFFSRLTAILCVEDVSGYHRPCVRILILVLCWVWSANSILFAYCLHRENKTIMIFGKNSN